jgi:tetratricopeptide (TPR) repeat protein
MRPLRESGLPIDSVAARLGVGTLVSGTLSGSLTAPVLTIRLVNADGTQLDSRTLGASAGEPLALEGALVEQVADFLRQRLGREITLRARRQGTRSDRAWLLLQQGEESRGQGKELLQRGDTLAAARVLAEADSLFARAATEDPRWLDPLLARGRLAALQYEFLRAPERRAAAVAQGLVFARRALDQAPGQPEALELRGVLRSYAARLQPGLDTVALDAAIGDLRAGSTPDNPNQARALSSLSAVLLERGRWQEAQLAAQRAFEKDAFLEQADRVLNDLYHTSLYLGQWNEAARWCETGRARFPENWLFSFCQLALELMPTDLPPQPERAWAMVRALDSLAPPADRTPGRWRMMVAAVLARAGQQDSARRTMSVARAMAPDDPEIDFYEAAAQVQLGEQAAAIAILRRIVERDPELRLGLAQDPAFRRLAGNAEFDALVR